MATTTHGFHYPVAADPPAGHTQMQTLAGDIETILLTGGYAEVNTSQTTTSATAIDLSTAGPSVTLTVPTNGIIAVRAQVTASVPSGVTASVYLVEDGSSLGAILSTTSASPVTLYTVPGSATGTTTRARAGALEFPATAGSHTYKLQYGSDGFQTATFVTRRLWVRLLPA